MIERPAMSGADRILARLLIALQTLFWGGYLLVLALLVVAAARYGSFDIYPFGDGDVRDPKEVLGLGIPGYILHLPLAIVVIAGTWPAAFVGVAGCIALAKARRIQGPLRWKLIGSTALTLAFVAVQLTPFGELVRVWMLD